MTVIVYTAIDFLPILLWINCEDTIASKGYYAGSEKSWQPVKEIVFLMLLPYNFVKGTSQSMGVRYIRRQNKTKPKGRARYPHASVAKTKQKHNGSSGKYRPLLFTILQITIYSWKVEKSITEQSFYHQHYVARNSFYWLLTDSRVSGIVVCLI